MRLALVLNPRAGGIDDADALVEAVRARCTRLTVHDIGEAEAAAAEAPDRIVVAGGDGSLGSVFQVADRENIALAVIPAGTANDFARALDLPLSVREAIELATYPHPELRKIWGGLANDRPFVNVASAGLAVDAAAYSERHKKTLGPLAYAVGAASAGMKADPVRATVAIDDEEMAEGRVWQLLVGASGRFGGGSGLGDAVPHSPKLTVAWVPAGPRATLPFRAFGLRTRTIERQNDVQSWQSQAVRVDASRSGKPAHWNLDGETWDPGSKRVEFEPLGPALVVAPG